MSADEAGPGAQCGRGPAAAAAPPVPRLCDPGPAQRRGAQPVSLVTTDTVVSIAVCSRQRLPNGRLLRFEVRFGSQAQEFSAVSGGRQHGGIVQVNLDNLNGRAVILA